MTEEYGEWFTDSHMMLYDIFSIRVEFLLQDDIYIFSQDPPSCFMCLRENNVCIGNVIGQFIYVSHHHWDWVCKPTQIGQSFIISPPEYSIVHYYKKYWSWWPSFLEWLYKYIVITMYLDCIVIFIIMMKNIEVDDLHFMNDCTSTS